MKQENIINQKAHSLSQAHIPRITFEYNDRDILALTSQLRHLH